MKADTLKNAIREAEHFVELAKAVPIQEYTIEFGPNKGKTARSIDSGRASGAARRASMDLTRALADLRQGK